MGGAARFLMLLSAPFPRLYPRPSAIRLPSIPLAPLAAARLPAAPALYHTSRPRLNYATRAAEQLHTHTAARDDRADPLAGTRASHRPWPEWSELVDYLAATGYSNGPTSRAPGDDDDSFAVQEGLPEEFVTAAGACLSFARDRPDVLRLLSKKDLEVVVENGSPLLFMNGVNSARRMRLFLSGNESNSPVSDRANTVDAMRYLLSYAHNLLNMSGGEDNIKTRESLDLSVRNLLNELVNVSRSGRESTLTDMTGRQVSIRQDQFSRAPMQNIEMKRGDWICPKCNFMNFARNMSCLQCAEGRPKRQLTGGEWECPQCDFFNYGRNTSCLRCDCRRPGETPLNTPTPSTARLGQNEKSSFESSISQSLDRILGRSSPSSGNIESRGRSNPLDNRQSTVNQRRDGGSVPFVPLPPDMFSKSQRTKSDTRNLSNQQDLAADGARQSSFLASGSFESGNPFNEKMKNPNENKNHKEELDKSETFFKKVSELDDSTDLATGISDDDFPEIMPMRKGENRFVISKKKDRSLTSPQYKRRMAMEQANSNFVPFVPFPPDYFAKKDKQPEAGSAAESSSKASSPLNTNQSTSGMSSESKSMLSDRTASGNVSQQPEITHTNAPKYNPDAPKNNPDVSWSSSTNNVYGGASRTSSHLSNNFLDNSRDKWNDKSQNNVSDTTSASKSSSQQAGNSHYTRDDQNRGFTGKSLEGSAVTEPDPLDMSEEAKAQRWFRRVAQIKDISELANIPDEDFPEIMPLRKGVNRFVVSKRKTPLERRLTSQQYRRNLPIVSSEPDKERNSE